MIERFMDMKVTLKIVRLRLTKHIQSIVERSWLVKWMSAQKMSFFFCAPVATSCNLLVFKTNNYSYQLHTRWCAVWFELRYYGNNFKLVAKIPTLARLTLAKILKERKYIYFFTDEHHRWDPELLCSDYQRKNNRTKLNYEGEISRWKGIKPDETFYFRLQLTSNCHMWYAHYLQTEQ